MSFDRKPVLASKIPLQSSICTNIQIPTQQKYSGVKHQNQEHCQRLKSTHSLHKETKGFWEKLFGLNKKKLKETSKPLQHAYPPYRVDRTPNPNNLQENVVSFAIPPEQSNKQLKTVHHTTNSTIAQTNVKEKQHLTNPAKMEAFVKKGQYTTNPVKQATVKEKECINSAITHEIVKEEQEITNSSVTQVKGVQHLINSAVTQSTVKEVQQLTNSAITQASVEKSTLTVQKVDKVSQCTEEELDQSQKDPITPTHRVIAKSSSAISPESNSPGSSSLPSPRRLTPQCICESTKLTIENVSSSKNDIFLNNKPKLQRNQSFPLLFSRDQRSSSQKNQEYLEKNYGRLYIPQHTSHRLMNNSVESDSNTSSDSYDESVYSPQSVLRMPSFPVYHNNLNAIQMERSNSNPTILRALPYIFDAEKEQGVYKTTTYMHQCYAVPILTKNAVEYPIIEDDLPPPLFTKNVMEEPEKGTTTTKYLDEVIVAPYRDTSPLWGKEGRNSC